MCIRSWVDHRSISSLFSSTNGMESIHIFRDTVIMPQDALVIRGDSPLAELSQAEPLLWNGVHQALHSRCLFEDSVEEGSVRTMVLFSKDAMLCTLNRHDSHKIALYKEETINLGDIIKKQSGQKCKTGEQSIDVAIACLRAVNVCRKVASEFHRDCMDSIKRLGFKVAWSDVRGPLQEEDEEEEEEYEVVGFNSIHAFDGVEEIE